MITWQFYSGFFRAEVSSRIQETVIVANHFFFLGNKPEIHWTSDLYAFRIRKPKILTLLALFATQFWAWTAGFVISPPKKLPWSSSLLKSSEVGPSTWPWTWSETPRRFRCCRRQGWVGWVDGLVPEFLLEKCRFGIWATKMWESIDLTIQKSGEGFNCVPKKRGTYGYQENPTTWWFKDGKSSAKWPGLIWFGDEMIQIRAFLVISESNHLKN